MLEFENKPIKYWTLAEAKEYCKNHTNKEHYCTEKNCILNDTENCIGFFCDMELRDNTIPKFTPDEIAFCRLIKKTYPWANYIARTSCDNVFYVEFAPKLSENKSFFIIRTVDKHSQIDRDFFPQIKPLTYYAIDDIIKQGDDNNA